MPTLTIDDRKIEVEEGTKVIEAAERLGIMIPRFCYHEALGSVGACRMCAVKFLEGPVKGLQMSCMIKARDGMIVSTTHPEAVEFRSQVIEWLMMNHPHDCPVCDEGGHCLLQDETISGGHGRRRYQSAKRTFEDQDLGPLVQHEMNRCIHCYRCVRFYREYAGYSDLGTMGIASRVYFGRFENGPLESPFSGNLIDICPTGVYTDKPGRFKARHWDLERGPSVCLHCSLGCNTTANGRYREMVRQEARPNKKVNGFFICDRGRYGFGYANSEERPRLAVADGRFVVRHEALTLAAQRLQSIVETAGEWGIAVLGSTRNSLETQLFLVHLCRNRQWRPPEFFIDPRMHQAVTGVVRQLDARLAASLRDLDECDLLLAVGLDPVNEAPMLALAMRQAVRNQAQVVVIDPRPVSLPFPFDHIAVPPHEIGQSLAQLVKNGLTAEQFQELPQQAQDLLAQADKEKICDETTAGFRDLASLIEKSQRPAILCGSRLAPETLPPFVLALARELRRTKGSCRFFFDPGGPNSVGAALLDKGNSGFVSTLEAIEAGQVKALLVVESDPLYDFPDRHRVEQALTHLDLLVVLDYLATPIFKHAHIRLPTATVFETGGSFINHAGLLQHASAVFQGGIPIRQVGEGGHPPRAYSNEIPGGETQSAFQTLVALGQLLGVRTPTVENNPWSLLPDDFSGSTGLRELGYPADGYPVLPGPEDTKFFDPPVAPATPSGERDRLTVLAVETLFGTEELSIHADIVQHIAPAPVARMHPEDAAEVDIIDKSLVRIPMGNTAVEMRVELTDRMARGHLILPRHHRLIEQIPSWPESIRSRDIKIVEETSVAS